MTDSILIVGGGTAGWLTALILASRLPRANGGPAVTLMEPPDIPIIGVGEGTWPGMRTTLRNAGIKEADFLRQCHASFKQGSKFVGWKDGSENDYYYHPFDAPVGFQEGNLAQRWVDTAPGQSFSKWVCIQEHLCEQQLSPKLPTSPEYAGVANYAYHLDAGKFSEFLKAHCVEELGVTLLRDKVTQVVAAENDDIAHVQTESSGAVAADLFVDCTGFRSLLLGQHFGVGFLDKVDELPINAALAVQVPYDGAQPINSATHGTAQEAGWIWDIGLSHRRGVGHVFSDAHLTDEQAAAQLQAYLALNDNAFEQLQPRRISIRPGYREKFWHRNCVAIGLSAGFLEPLEASAMMLVEASANRVADQLPANRDAMAIVAKRFNQRFEYRWQRIIDFLKLHYVLTQRKESFWQDAANPSTLSDRLTEDLALWRHQAPWKNDFDSLDEAFPAASYQYVLYGMGYRTHSASTAPLDPFAGKAIDAVSRQSNLLQSKVESNRNLLDRIQQQ